MVFAPDNTTLYMGFRAPLVPTANRTKAVIAPVQLFETFFNNGSPIGNPVIGAPIELDLGGRGIREIIRLSGGGYIILAGSSDGVLNPAVYSWTGMATDAAVAQPNYNVAGLNIEGAMQINNNGQPVAGKLQLISDDGDNVFYGDGVAAKDLTQNNYKKFRSDVITSSTILPLHFLSFTANESNNKVSLQWTMAQADQSASFAVYRSEDGRNFYPVKKMNAVAGKPRYDYTDDSTFGRAAYYRIKATDIAGKEVWSAVIIVNKPHIDNSVSIYPNPVNGTNSFTIYSTTPGSKTVQVFTVGGALYKAVSFAETSVEINTAGWPKGTYNVLLTTAPNATISRQVVVN